MTRIKNNRIASQSDYRNVQSAIDSSAFDAKEYKDNELAIANLYKERESAFAEKLDLKNQLDDLVVRHHKLEVQKKEIDIKFIEANNRTEKLTDLEKQMEDLKFQIQSITLEKREREIKLEVANQKLDGIKQNATLNFIATTLGAVLFTLGTDVLTSHPDNWLAWILAAAGVIVGFIAFFMSRRIN